MRYKSGADFRRALEERLRSESLRSGIPLTRLRKMVVFDRFLARLVKVQPGQWILKGGLALQLRIGVRARTTKDMDLLNREEVENQGDRLASAAKIDIGDWFTFEVENQTMPLPEEAKGARYQVHSRLDGRMFEMFHIDVSIGDPVTSEVDILATPPLLSFADIPPTSFPCYPLTQHLAEKLHAYTRPYNSGESSRVKDLVDVLLIIQENRINGKALNRAIQATFKARNTHQVPKSLPDPPRSWDHPYQRLAVEVGLQFKEITIGFSRAQSFFAPLFAENDGVEWDPETGTWKNV